MRSIRDRLEVLLAIVLLMGCGSEVVGSQLLSSESSLLADPCADAAGTGTYRGYICEGERSFITAEGISCQDTRRKCQLNAEASPGSSFYCTWNDRVVYRKDVSAGACNSLTCKTTSGIGQRVLNICYSPDDVAPAIISDGMSCQDALDNCKRNADVNSHRSILCHWRGLEIFRRELTVGSCGSPSSM